MAKIICTVTNDLSYDQRMIRICSSLAKAGYEVVLIGRQLPGSIPLQQQIFQQKRITCRFNKGKLFYLEYNLRLFILLFQHPFDLLCAVDLDTLLPTFLWSRFRQKPLVYDAHEYFTEVPEVVDRPLTKAIWSTLARLIIPRLHHAYTVGPGLARILSARYGIPFAVIRNLPESTRPTRHLPASSLPSQRPDAFILLYQGALNQGRGIETAIQALQLLPPSVQLWLVGEGDLSSWLRQMTRELGLTNRVHFLGYRQPLELASITPQADLGLNLLENKGLSYYYSLANKCFDYIQAGLPAIHMDFPEYRALHEEYPAFLLLPDLNPANLAQMIEQLRNNPQQLHSLHNQCQKAARHLTWEQEAPHLLSIYQKITPL